MRRLAEEKKAGGWRLAAGGWRKRRRLAAGGREEGWRLAEEKKAGGWRLAVEKKAGGRRLAEEKKAGGWRLAAGGAPSSSTVDCRLSTVDFSAGGGYCLTVYVTSSQ
jgi:hypothetical protein